MKKQFTIEYILSNRGCYEREEARELYFMKGKIVLLTTILKSDIPIKDKAWFLVKKCDLTLSQKIDLAVRFAECVLPIYEEKYPNDNRVRNCIEITKKYNSGNATIEELRSARSAAYDAASAAYDAAYDAAYAAYDAAYATYSTYTAAYYSDEMQQTMLDFVKAN